MAAASTPWNSSMSDHPNSRVGGGARTSYPSNSSGGGRSDAMHYVDQSYAQPQSQHSYAYGASGTVSDGYGHSYHHPPHHQDSHHAGSGMNELSPRSSYHGGSPIDPRLPHGGPATDYPSARSSSMSSTHGSQHVPAHPIYSHPLSSSVSYGAGRGGPASTNSSPSAGHSSVMLSAYAPSAHISNEEYNGSVRASAHGAGQPRSDYHNMRSWQTDEGYARGHNYPSGNANATYSSHQQYSLPAGSHHNYERGMVRARSPAHRDAVNAPGIDQGVMVANGGSSRKKRPQLECAVCHSTSTPEWRKGPTGPRTLCNACGLTWAKMAKRKKKEAEDAGLPEPPSPSVSGTGEADLRELQALRPNAAAAAAAAASGMVGGGAPLR